MSIPAGDLYGERAAAVGTAVPTGLFEGSYMMPLAGGDGSLQAQAFCEYVTPMEPVVLAGVTLMRSRDGHLPLPATRSELAALPRTPRYTSVEKHAGCVIKPYAAELAAHGVAGVQMEPLTPFGIPEPAFKRATNHWPGLMERRYAPSQIFILFEPLGAAALGGYLTLMQGVHTIHANRFGVRKEYLTPRYSGTRLSYDEVQAIRAYDQPSQLKYKP